jgi:SAM-dependent methyltransferase
VGVVLFDKFADSAPGVEKLDINALDALPDNACDVLTLLRASYFVLRPAEFLAEARHIVRPGGLVVVDWLHGLSQAPVLDLRGDPRYDTKGDAVHDHLRGRAAGGGLRRRVRGPHPARESPAILGERGAPGCAGAARRTRPRLLGRGPRGDLTVATYLHRCRDALARARKHLIEPPLMERYFTVVFRHARYFYPYVRKFNLYVLTILEPLGK